MNVAQQFRRFGTADLARANLANAQAVQQTAEERLKNGLATLPDVLEGRSATAEAEYELQSVFGIEQIAAGNLATVLGASATSAIHVQPLKELSIPDAVDESVAQLDAILSAATFDTSGQRSRDSIGRTGRTERPPVISGVAEDDETAMRYRSHRLGWRE